MTQASDVNNVVSLVPRKPEANGHGPHIVMREEEPAASSLLKFLPAIYSKDPFVGQFLRIFEDVLTPIQTLVDNQPYYFDPLTAPKEILDWLAFWVDVGEGLDWTESKRRALVVAAPVIYRMRGTKEGIKMHLGIYAGPGGITLINERTDGFRLDKDTRVGLNTSIGSDMPHVFTVTVAVPNLDDIDKETLESILDADKPVETSYILRIIKLGAGS